MNAVQQIFAGPVDFKGPRVFSYRGIEFLELKIELEAELVNGYVFEGEFHFWEIR